MLKERVKHISWWWFVFPFLIKYWQILKFFSLVTVKAQRHCFNQRVCMEGTHSVNTRVALDRQVNGWDLNFDFPEHQIE